MIRAAATAPGKLILMGEHAVVYGHPALVAAVDLRLRTRVSPAEPGSGVHLRLPDLGHRERTDWPEILEYTRAARRRWKRFADEPDGRSFRDVRGDDPAHVAKIALGEAALDREAGEGLDLTLTVESDLPVGSGFGSSAALAVAVLAAYLRCRGTRPGRERLERLALEVERRQHGLPSGVDSATVVHGGLVWADRPDGGSGLRTDPLGSSSPHLRRFAVFDSGPPAQETGELVAAVRERVQARPGRYEQVLDRMGETVRAFRDELATDADRPERVVDLVRRYERDLEALGVVPAPVREVIRAVEERGGAAKISGAGALDVPPGSGCGAGTVLVYHPSPDRLEGRDFLSSLDRYGVRLAAPGYRVEAGS